ncbi:hypothetical protein [Hymenobacter setariae]|uniref:hypothetical protein n=1 Tax=Hymenobacter setariae TaxID=2594794 RepID=UPI001F3020C1|nr:hypothetical protein [Hymenobacter setariae]
MNLSHHLNQLLLLNKQVNHTYYHYKVENPFDGCADKHNPGIHNVLYLTRMGQTWESK